VGARTYPEAGPLLTARHFDGAIPPQAFPWVIIMILSPIIISIFSWGWAMA